MSSNRYAASIAHIPMPAAIARLRIHPELRMPLPWFWMQDWLPARQLHAG